MRILGALALIVGMTGTAVAENPEPFGIKAGAAVNEYGGFISQFGQHITAPTPHPMFTSYVVHSTPKTGICLVRGKSDDLETRGKADTGENIREAFDKMKSQLESRYGPGQFSESFSIFPYDNEWIKDLAKGEKYYHASWKFDHTGDGIGITEIILYLDAPKGFRNPYRTYVNLSVQYEFTNYDECEKEKTATEQAGEDAEASKL